jgi:hypothetical protein
MFVHHQEGFSVGTGTIGASINGCGVSVGWTTVFDDGLMFIPCWHGLNGGFGLFGKYVFLKSQKPLGSVFISGTS